MKKTENKTVETTITSEQTSNEAQAEKKWGQLTTEKILELMAQGVKPEEAIQQVLQEEETKIKVKGAGRQVIDRIAYIQGLTNIQEVRKSRKIAYAKQSKSKDKPEALARYKKEVEVATTRLNELMAEVNQAECPWRKAIELGETVDGAIQFYIQDLENQVAGDWEKAGKGATKAQIKVFCQKATINLELVPEELRASAKSRIDRKDMRLISTLQKAQALKDLEAGTRKIEKEEKAG